MKLYLDDDCASRLLARLLRQAGHQVEMPLEADLYGASDPVHLTHALREGRQLLTANFADFQELHDPLPFVLPHDAQRDVFGEIVHHVRHGRILRHIQPTGASKVF